MWVYLILTLAIILNALANILMKVGMLNQEGIRNIFDMFIRLISNPIIIIGVICFALGLAAYCYVLTKVNLSIAYPIMTSLGYMIVILASWIFLKEHITRVQVVGFIFIIAGVWMVAS